MNVANLDSPFAAATAPSNRAILRSPSKPDAPGLTLCTPPCSLAPHMALHLVPMLVVLPIFGSGTGIVAALRELATSVDARAHAEALRTRLAHATADDGLSAGVGGPKRGATGAHLALLQAEQAVVIGRAMSGDGAVTMFEDLGPYTFVLGRPESDIREFADRTLGPLADGEQHAELVRTLDA